MDKQKKVRSHFQSCLKVLSSNLLPVSKRVFVQNNSYENDSSPQVHYHANQTRFHMKGFVLSKLYLSWSVMCFRGRSPNFTTNFYVNFISMHIPTLAIYIHYFPFYPLITRLPISGVGTHIPGHPYTVNLRISARGAYFRRERGPLIRGGRLFHFSEIVA